MDSLVLPPGKRYEVLVQSGTSGTHPLKTRRFDQGGDPYPETTWPPLPGRAQPSRRAATADPRAARRPRLGNGRPEAHGSSSPSKTSNIFTIDGKQFDPNRVDQQVALGAVEEWTIRNDTEELHPFHIHVNDFQVISVNGRPTRAASRTR